METKIQCPICFTDRMCFDEYVEKDNYHSYLCFRCGFTSNSNYAFGKEEIKLALESSPKLVKELSFRDYKRYVVWIPSVVNMGDKGIIFPEGTKEDWNWRYAKVVEIPEGEREKYQGHKHSLDVENASIYNKHEFIEACREMGIVEEI